MATKKITLNELRTLVKQIIKDESENYTEIKKVKNKEISSLKKIYQQGSDVYNAMLKDKSMGQKAIEGRIKQMDIYFNENRNLSLDAIARGSQEPSKSQTSPYYTGAILVYLGKTAFQSGFYSAMNKKPLNFNSFYDEVKADVILDKVLEVSLQQQPVSEGLKLRNYLK